MKQKSYSPATTVQKAFRLLEILSKSQPTRPSDLVQRLKLTRSNVHRLLATLEGLGYVEKGTDLKYRLTLKMFLLGNMALQSTNLPEVANPHMIRLAELSHENVNLAVVYKQKVLYIGKIESPHYLKIDRPVGEADPLHCTALGKVLLSGQTEEELEAFFKSAKLHAFTKKTVTEDGALRGIIRNVKKQGFATDFEELSDGIHCVATPIRDHTGKVIAAISISGPAVRLTKSKIGTLKAPLLDTAAKISNKLGYPNLDNVIS